MHSPPRDHLLIDYPNCRSGLPVVREAAAGGLMSWKGQTTGAVKERKVLSQPLFSCASNKPGKGKKHTVPLPHREWAVQQHPDQVIAGSRFREWHDSNYAALCCKASDKSLREQDRDLLHARK